MRADAGTRTTGQRDLVLRVGRDRHLLLHRDAGRARIDEEEVDVALGLTGAREHDQRGRRRRERHVPLDTVEHEVVAVGRRAQLHAARPESVARLEPSRGENRIAGDDARQPLPLLLLTPGSQQHARTHDRAHEMRRRRERPPELRVDDCAFERAHLRAAVLGRDHEPDQIERGHLLPELGGEPDGIVLQRAHCLERRVRAAYAAHHLPQHLLLGGKVEIHQLRAPARASSSVTGATGRRGASRGCRRRWSAARCARCNRS